MRFNRFTSWWQNQPESVTANEARSQPSPLANIPVEFQEIFRQTLEQEMADSGNDLTDKDRLAYLRNRREACLHGQYVDPNGRMGQLPLSRQELHAQGVTRPQTGPSADKQAHEKRLLGLKLAGLALAAVVFFLLVSRGRDGHEEALTPTPELTSQPPSATPTPAILTFTGDSVARWEGDVLVVETLGLRDEWPERTLLPGLVVGAKSKVIERFSLLGPNELFYQFSVEDPELYKEPWSAEYVMARQTVRFFEHACHEGNYSLGNILRIARAAERKRQTSRSE